MRNKAVLCIPKIPHLSVNGSELMFAKLCYPGLETKEGDRDEMVNTSFIPPSL